MNLVNTLQIIVANMLIYSTPLIFTSIGGVFSERGGIVNVGLEGIMTIGAFSSVVFNLTTAGMFGSMTPWLSILFGALIGALFSSLHAVATVNLRADHIVSGTVLNLMAPALGVFLLQVFYQQGQININEQIGYWNVPLLSNIPVIGKIFFSQTSLPGFLAIVVAILAWYVLFKTRFGLRLRSVGENPQAADTLGLNVYALRYTGVLISGVLGGIGGALFAQSIAGNFSASTIVGQGFMSMAAMIFGRWNPVGAMAAALFFGFSQSMAIVGAQLPLLNQVPAVYLQVAPYVFTVLILVVFFAKSKAPAADGVNYIKSV